MRLHVREEARVFAPPFSFLPRNCYRAGEFSCRPSLSPHQGGGSERASSPTRGALFILGAASSRHQQEGFLARLREHRIPRVLTWPEHRHATAWPPSRPPTPSVSWSISPTASSPIANGRITTSSGQTCALKPRPLATGWRALPTSSCSPQLDNSIWPAHLQNSTRSRCG